MADSEGKEGTPKKGNQNSSKKNGSLVHDLFGIKHTRRFIALSLLSLYGISLIMILIIAAYKDSSEWLNLFKDGFFILGGALSTIIGYYFGSKVEELERKQQEAENSQKEAEKTVQEAEKTEQEALEKIEQAIKASMAYQMKSTATQKFMESISKERGGEPVTADTPPVMKEEGLELPPEEKKEENDKQSPSPKGEKKEPQESPGVVKPD